MTFTPSPQQADFLNWVSNGSGSCVLEAVAGAGKTTTLLEAVDRTGGGVAILAYNKMIAEEIKGKLLKRGVDWKTAEAGTVHSFGFRAYRKAFPKVQVEGGKTFAVLDQMFKGAPAHHISRTHGAGIANLVSLAKQRAIGVTGSIDNRKLWSDIVGHFGLFGDDGDDMIEDLIEVAIAALKTSNLTTDVIDFDDMVYLPLVHKVRFWRYKWVFVDEAQDTNPARRALVKAILAPFGRVVAVGDRAQAIYGFTGADADSLDLIADEFNAVRMPLTTTYRCPKAVVSFAQRWVSHITAADTAPEGEVLSIEAREFFERQDLGRGSAVLCRNTAPIISLAFQLIRQGIGCRVEGRDIGQGLIKLATKWKTVKTLAGLESALEKWQTGRLPALRRRTRLPWPRPLPISVRRFRWSSTAAASRSGTALTTSWLPSRASLRTTSRACWFSRPSTSPRVASGIPCSGWIVTAPCRASMLARSGSFSKRTTSATLQPHALSNASLRL